jgi:hypothetical protein
MKHLTFFLFVLCELTFIISAKSQSYRIIEKLPKTIWSGKEKGAILNELEKEAFLAKLPKGEKLPFIMEYEEGDTIYWDSNSGRSYFIDLDFDGDLDLLYTGVNGGMRQMATKVYYNENGELVFKALLKEGIFDIKKNINSYSVFTIFEPCCDSYTTRIDHYDFSASKQGVFVESVSMIGSGYTPMVGMPDFSTEKSVTVNNPSFYAFNRDFNGVSGYFRARNKEVKKALKEHKIIELVKVEGKVPLSVLSQTIFKEQVYFLVISDLLSGLPKMPNSLYEWTSGDNRRLVGWVKKADVD